MTGQAPFSRDEPAALNDDAFGHRDYTETLVSIVTDAAPPATVGLFGPWGVGKSTIVGGLQERLLDRDAAFAYFDAWRYEGDSLRRQFLLDTAVQLEKNGRLRRGYKVKEKLRDLHVDTQEVDESLRFSKAGLAKAVVIGAAYAIVGIAFAYFGLFDAVVSGNIGSQLLVAAVAFVFGSLTSLLSQSIVIAPTTTTLRVLQDPDRFAEKFAELLNHMKPPRLVVAIDNLDRCSPDKAVELLSTIKTYLEPTVAGDARPRSGAADPVQKTVIFVISVDDQALRRHLIAQESASSRDVDPADLRRYVDEYLAKFFSARLPIRTILPYDMRAYVAEGLKPLVSGRGINEEEARELISVVATGLRRNPRMVKQFRNDLESRLRLLEEREAKSPERNAGIDPPVSGDVAMVAKLALIEYEWPDAFDRLQRDPSLLGSWESEAQSNDEVDWNPQEVARNQLDTKDAERARTERLTFADFIRQARAIQSPHLRAMLKLKQSQNEAGLPAYFEFREAVVGGERAEVERILGSEAERDRERLAGCIPEIFIEEVEAGYLANARGVVDVVLSVDGLAAFRDVRAAVLRSAASLPRVRSELGLLDAEVVLRNATLVDEAQRPFLVQPFVDRLGSDDLGIDERGSAGRALAIVASELTEVQTKEVRATISSEAVRSDFGRYRALVEAMPPLLPSEAASSAMDALQDSGGDSESTEDAKPSFTANQDALAIVRLALSGPYPDLRMRVIGHAAQILEAKAGADDLTQELSVVEELLDLIDDVDEAQWSRLVEGVVAKIHAFSEDQRPRIVQFVNKYLSRTTAEARESVPRRMVESVFENPLEGIALTGHFEEATDAFRVAVRDQLSRLATDPAYSDSVAEALIQLDEPSAAEDLARMVAQLFDADQGEAARRLLEHYREILQAHLPAIAGHAASNASRDIRAGKAPEEHVAFELSRLMDAGALTEIAEGLLERVKEQKVEPAIETLELLEIPSQKPLRTEFARVALNALLNLPKITPELESMLAAVCRTVDALDADQQLRLVDKLHGWLVAGRRPLIARNVATMTGLRAKPALALVEALIEAEQIASDQNVKQELMAAALANRGPDRSLASKRLLSRKAELEGARGPGSQSRATMIGEEFGSSAKDGE